MHSRTDGFQLVLFIALGLLLVVLLSTPASAELVPFTCVILPGQDTASILMTNSLASDASCIVTCKFSTTKYDNNPQITCAKPVPAGKEVEMCLMTSGGDKLVRLTEGHAECTEYVPGRTERPTRPLLKKPLLR
jgi:hypothetical protein